MSAIPESRQLWLLTILPQSFSQFVLSFDLLSDHLVRWQFRYSKGCDRD